MIGDGESTFKAMKSSLVLFQKTYGKECINCGLRYNSRTGNRVEAELIDLCPILL